MGPDERQRREFRERGYTSLGQLFDAPALAESGAAYDGALRHPSAWANAARAPSSTARSSTCRARSLR
jgi:hypothetical protein